MRDQRVLVTGASGFLAMHCIQQLLEHGYTVRGTLRTLKRVAEVRSALNDRSGAVELVACDLRSDVGWNEACTDCSHVLHVASPFPRIQPADPDEVIRPARDGTLRLLEAALRAGVRRVVLTSSMNAVAGNAPRKTNYVYRETDWTDLTDRKLSPYDRSKVLAERAAWDFAAAHPQLELSVIAPGAILGPSLGPGFSVSADIVRLLLSGAVRRIPRVGFAPVDVRDAAAAHVAAISIPQAGGARFICALSHVWMDEVAYILWRRFAAEGWHIPMQRMPDFVARGGALFNPGLKRIAHALGHRRLVDNSRIRQILHWRPRGIEEMVISTAESLLARGAVSPHRT